MPDWKRTVARRLVKSLNVAARELERRTVTKRCPFWDCKARIHADGRFCNRHWTEFEKGLIDKCPGCRRFKYEQDGQCLKCSGDPQRLTAQGHQDEPGSVAVESSQRCAAWGCGQTATYDRPLCYPHWEEWEAWEVTSRQVV